MATKRPSSAIEIKTPQAFIHIEHKISLLQYKYWLLILREFKRQIDLGVPAEEDGWRYLKMSEVAAFIGYTPNKSELWADLESLKNETIAYNVLSKDGGTGKRGMGFISEWEVHATRVGFKLPSFIESGIKSLDEPRSIFQILNWEIFNAFTGKYEAIIYKLCRDYRGVSKTPFFDLPAFRRYMGIHENEYKDFRDLNRVVISGAVKKINENKMSDLMIDVVFEKQGRKTVGLHFKITPKQQSIIPLPEDHPAFRFAKIPINPATQQKYLEMCSEDEIMQNIQRANQYGEQQIAAGKKVNYGAVYNTAMKEGWYKTIQSQQEIEEVSEKRSREHQQVIQAKADEEAAKAADQVAKINAAFDAFNALPESRKDEIREDFRATISVIVIRKAFDREGEQAPLVRSQFAQYFLSLPANKKK